jgi:hypothetical protein
VFDWYREKFWVRSPTRPSHILRITILNHGMGLTMGLPCAIIGALDCSAPLSMELSGPGPYARTQVSQLARTQVSQLAEQGVPGFVMLDLTLERPYDPRLRPDPRTVTTGNNNLWFLRVCVCVTVRLGASFGSATLGH